MKNTIFKDIAEINTLLFKALYVRYKEMNLNVTPLQSRIIMIINDSNEELCQKDLEKIIGCNKSTLSSVLSTMEKNGFIEKTDSNGDFRRNIIRLTDSSIAIVKKLKKDNKELNELLTKDITEDEMEEFSKIAEKLKNNIGGI